MIIPAFDRVAWSNNVPFPVCSKLSRGTAFPTRLNQRPVKTQIREFTVRLKTFWILGYPQSALRRLRSDCADAQTDLSLRWAHQRSCRKCVPRYIVKWSERIELYIETHYRMWYTYSNLMIEQSEWTELYIEIWHKLLVDINAIGIN